MTNSIEQARSHPPGTLINGNSDHDRFTRTDHGGWVYGDGQPFGFETIRGYPEPDAIRPAEFWPMTLPQLQRSVRNVALGQGQQHGVRGVDSIIGRLGLPVFDGVHPGDYIHRHHHPSWNAAVADSLTLAVGSFRNWDTLHLTTAARINAGRQGIGPHLQYATLYWVPGEPPGETVDEHAVLAFKRRLWEEGVRGKSDYSWCGVFEATLAWFGIDDAILDDTLEAPPPAGVRVTPEQVAELPERSIVAWRHERGDAWSWFVRDDNAPIHNRARTRYLLGPTHGEWASENMTLVYNPDDGPMNIPLTEALSEALPHRSRVDDGGVRRVKQANGGWGNASRTYHDLNHPETAVIVEIPGVNV